MVSDTHHRAGRRLRICAYAAIGAAGLAWRLQAAPPEAAQDGPETPSVICLPDGDGYVRARITGALNAELTWDNDGTECTGALRPTDGGARMRFSRSDPAGDAPLVLLFGVAGLREGEPAPLLPVNVTVMREGAGEFYSTQGDDKCMLENVRQTPIAGAPHDLRSYRVAARGFCTEPARAVRGPGAVLLSRFDIAGRVDYGAQNDNPGHEAQAPATIRAERR
jgi:hypothetical protein